MRISILKHDDDIQPRVFVNNFEEDDKITLLKIDIDIIDVTLTSSVSGAQS